MNCAGVGQRVEVLGVGVGEVELVGAGGAGADEGDLAEEGGRGKKEEYPRFHDRDGWIRA